MVIVVAGNCAIGTSGLQLPTKHRVFRAMKFTIRVFRMWLRDLVTGVLVALIAQLGDVGRPDNELARSRGAPIRLLFQRRTPVATP